MRRRRNRQRKRVAEMKKLSMAQRVIEMSRSGQQGILKKDWKADLGIGHVLQVVRCLLINPFAESALNEEAGKLFMEEYDAYFKRAQMMTEVHAAAVNKGEASSAGVVVGEGGD